MAGTASVKAMYLENPDLEMHDLKEIVSTGRMLGKGAFGKVMELEMAGTRYAGKQIHDILLGIDVLGVQSLIKKFSDECRLMAAVKHPNVVQFNGICFLDDTDHPVLVMELMDMSLDYFLQKRQGHIPLSLKYRILLDITRGLLFLHTRDPVIIHRDLTSRNVLLNKASLQAKIADLGNALMTDSKQLMNTLSKMPGTALYMPPEASGAKPVYDSSLDIFSFGHLSLYVATEVFPDDLLPATYTDSLTEKVKGNSEVKRREEYLNILYNQEDLAREDHPFCKMVTGCLHNLPNKRPTAKEILSILEDQAGSLEDLYSTLDGACKLDLIELAHGAGELSRHLPDNSLARSSSLYTMEFSGRAHALRNGEPGVLDVYRKKGGFATFGQSMEWKQYVFKIQDERLKYYKSNRPSRAVGEIHLRTVTSVSKFESEDTSKYSFLVTFDSDSIRSKLIGSHLPSSPLRLSTVTAVERFNWMEAIQPGCVSTYIIADQQQEIGKDSSDGVDSSGYEQVDLSEPNECAIKRGTTAECTLAEDAIQDVLPMQAVVSEDGYECVEAPDLNIHGEMGTAYQQPSGHYLDQNVEDDSSIENSNEIDDDLYDEVPNSLDDEDLYEDIPPFLDEPIVPQLLAQPSTYFATPQPAQLGSHISSSPFLAQPDTPPPQQCVSFLAPPVPAERSTQVPIPSCHISVRRNLPPPRLSPKPGSSVPPSFTMPSVTSQPVLSEDTPSSSEQVDQLRTLYKTIGKFLERSPSLPVNLASSFLPQTIADSNENPPPSSGYENIYEEVEKSSTTESHQNTLERPKPPVPKPRAYKLQPPPHLEADAKDSEPLNQYEEMKMLMVDSDDADSDDPEYAPRPEWAKAATTSSLQEDESLQVLQHQQLFIPRSRIQNLKEIGQGHYGKVYKAEYTKGTGQKLTVAVKTIKKYTDQKAHDDFLKEMGIMSQFVHPNIIKLHGLVQQDYPWIILEYLKNGDLRSFLKKNPNCPVSTLVKYMLGVATGMDYIAKIGLVHRDIAARNIIVGSNETCKISDFGLLREIPKDDSIYVSKQLGPVPVRWMAPESLLRREFSTATDVWSYGVLLWELSHPSEVPYAEEVSTNLECATRVTAGLRLVVPCEYPDEVKRIMRACWQKEAAKRPSFLLISTVLQHIDTFQ